MGSESLDSSTVDCAGNGKFAADKEVLMYLQLRIRIHVVREIGCYLGKPTHAGKL